MSLFSDLCKSTRDVLKPFSALDIERALEIVKEVGESPRYLVGIIQHNAEMRGETIEDVDPVYVVYEDILAHAVSEIRSVTRKDIISPYEMYTYSNGLNTCYDNNLEEVADELAVALKEAGASKDSFDDKVQWFFDEIGVQDYTSIEGLREELSELLPFKEEWEGSVAITILENNKFNVFEGIFENMAEVLTVVQKTNNMVITGVDEREFIFHSADDPTTYYSVQIRIRDNSDSEDLDTFFMNLGMME